jgi:polar amino acid transport system permease protein
LFSVFLVIYDPRFNEVFLFLIPGIPLTIGISSLSFILTVGLGTLLILGIRSHSVILRNISLFYMATIGSIPLYFLIMIIGFVLLGTTDPRVEIRFVLALSIAYSVFWTEKYLAELENYTNHPNTGEQKKDKFNLFWPVPFKRIMLLLGIILVGILKDSAWMHVLGIQDVSRLSRIHAGSTFLFSETYLVTILLYLLLTIPFNSVLVYHYQKTGE